MKEVNKSQQDVNKLFYPSYAASVRDLSRYTKTAKKFLKLIMSSFEEIAQVESSLEFQKQIALVVARSGVVDPNQERIEFIREVKLDMFTTQLNQMVSKLHLDQSIVPTELDRLKDQIILVYDHLLNKQATVVELKQDFELKVNSIVSQFLHNISDQLVDPINSSQPNKYKKYGV